MPTTYMIFWSIIVILFFGATKLRRAGQIVTVMIITAGILFLSDALFVNLSQAAGIVPGTAVNPSDYLAYGPLAWLALLVMPFGWLGPILGLNLVNRQASPPIEIGV